MMKHVLKVLLFILAFQMEVRVRASEGVSYPEACLGKNYPCSFKVTADKWNYKVGTVTLHAGADTILTETKKNQEWKLVEGGLWVENAPSAKIITTASEVEGSSGQYWVFVTKDRTVYRNISSKLVVTLKDHSRVEIPKGFEMWVGAVNTEAQVEHGMVEPVDLKSHLKAWYELYPGTRAQFVSEVQDLKDQWADLIEKSGDIYKRVAQRKYAALDDEKRAQQELKQKQQQERLRLREEYRQRVFEK
jgi:hypothetical protein